jgi:hypothetical protein
MAFDSNQGLLKALLNAKKPSEVKDILDEAGDSADLETEESFGDLDLEWRFYGGNSSNMSTINLGSNPGRSLIERVTNAIDAILEGEMHRRGGPEPNSPMDAAKKWFGRPPSTIDSGIFTWDDFGTKELDRQVHVCMQEGDEDAAPTIDIKDSGIGIEPGDFPDTILSLHKGNKIKKNYLAGAFGQGGSATFSFCDYTLILSRHADDPSRVGFTVVKLMNLGENWSEDAYVYLSDGDSVPSCTIEGGIDLYDKNPNDLKDTLSDFSKGTLVRHFGYRIEDYSSPLSPSPTNLYHFLHRMMFDPILPFRVVDLRDGKYDDELVTGNRNRLMNRAKQGERVDEGSSGAEVVHYQPEEMVSPLSDSNPCVGVEYWVIFHWKEKPDRMRSWSNNNFSDKRHPIIGTLNGQNQGELTSLPIKKLDFSMIPKNIVVHINSTDADKDVRRSLFSSTREGFKDDIALDSIIDLLQVRMEEDDRLDEIERALIEDLLSEETEDTDEEVRKEISQLLQDAGFEVGEPGQVSQSGEDGDENDESGVGGSGGSGSSLEPLQTLTYPNVTEFQIAYPTDELEVPVGGSHARRVRIETNANFRFDRKDFVNLRCEPKILEIASEVELQGGHKYWRLRATEGASVGDTSEVIVTITKPDGSQLRDTVNARIIEKPPASDEKVRGEVPSFDIREIDPYEDTERFTKIWDEASEEDIPHIAYRSKGTKEGVIVFYSTGFEPYQNAINRVKNKSSLYDLFKKNYKIWIGYHAILQSQESKNMVSELGVDEEVVNKVQEKERALVAIMQAEQAVRTAQTQQDAISAKAS